MDGIDLTDQAKGPFDATGFNRSRGAPDHELDLERTPAPSVVVVTHSIGQAAARSGLSVDTLRYYERIGLVDPPARDAGGRRSYSDDDLGWLHFLTKMRTTGMPLAMLREYAALRHGGPATSGRRKRILVEHRTALLEHLAELRSSLDVINYKIDNYARIERDLDTSHDRANDMEASA